MALVLRLLLVAVFAAFIIEFVKAKDLKEIAKALREKRENEVALQQKAEDELVERQKRQGGGCGKGGGGGGCGGGGGGGCGCCCCCCCCCCGCGKKKRDILSVLRAKRNSVDDDVTKIAANDSWGYGGYSDYDGEKGYGTGRGGESSYGNKNSGDENCNECDGQQ